METERGKNSKPPDSSHEGTARAAESPKETTNNSLPQGDENKLKVELPGKEEKFFPPLSWIQMPSGFFGPTQQNSLFQTNCLQAFCKFS